MANYTQILETQHALEVTLEKKLCEFEKKYMQSNTTSGSSISSLPEEFQDFKTEVSTVLNLLRQQISALVGVMDTIEMRHRRKYLLIGGITEDIKADELVTFTSELIQDKLHLPEVTADKIAVCHRLGKLNTEKSRPILIRFTDFSIKAKVWKQKTNFKGTSHTVSEFLTRRKQSLFLQARKHFGMRKCWTMDGNILVLMPDGSRRRLHNEEDLSKAIDSTKIDHPTEIEPSIVASPETRNKKSRRVAKKK
ncbi:uncharacterized protein LOC131847235 [Achroia grisella]|uniref:uncharacterized protein LOC131847235 n=1 Tax=Achroia grisella TaxID=688607 RepID=UPI0027D32D3C|nr:uncharacterized protein LOC131847235 [Achroia grisella]